MANNRDEIWHISNRHLRLCPYVLGRMALRFPLEALMPKTARAA